MVESFHPWLNRKPGNTTIKPHQEERVSLHTDHYVQMHEKQNHQNTLVLMVYGNRFTS